MEPVADALSAAADDINLDRQMRALFLKRMSKPSLGEMVGEQVDQQIAAQITSKLVGNLLGGPVLPTAEPKGAFERAFNTFLNSQMGAAVGQTLVEKGMFYLGPTRVGALADNFIRQHDENYQGVPIEEQKNINRGLIARYEQGLPPPPGAGSFFNSQPPDIDSGSEWLLRLNPDDPSDQQLYMSRKGMSGVGIEDVHRIMNRDIEKARKEAMGVGTDIMSSVMPSSSGDDGWKETDVGKPRVPATTSDENMGSPVNAPESTNASQDNVDVPQTQSWEQRMEGIVMNLAAIMDKNAEMFNKNFEQLEVRLTQLESVKVLHGEEKEIAEQPLSLDIISSEAVPPSKGENTTEMVETPQVVEETPKMATKVKVKRKEIL